MNLSDALPRNDDPNVNGLMRYTPAERMRLAAYELEHQEIVTHELREQLKLCGWMADGFGSKK